MNSCKKIVIAFLLILGLQTSTQEVHAFPWKTLALSTAVVAASVLLYQYWPEISTALKTSNPDQQAPTIKAILRCIHEKITSFECSSYTPSGCIKELCSQYSQFAQDCVINLVQGARECFGKCVANGGSAIAAGTTAPIKMGIIQNCTALCTANYMP